MSDRSPAASTNATEAQRQASRPFPLIEHAGKNRPGEPAARVGHVVEADVHRHLVAVGVVEDQERVHGGVEREHRPEYDQTDDDHGGEVDPRDQRDRDPSRGRPRARTPAGWLSGRRDERPPWRPPADSRGATPARCRQPITQTAMNVPTCQKLHPQNGAQIDRKRDDEPHVARSEQQIRAAASKLTARLFENM